jgi:hypothetical protein
MKKTNRVLAGSGQARLGMASHGKARPGSAECGAEWQGTASTGMARFGTARFGAAGHRRRLRPPQISTDGLLAEQGSARHGLVRSAMAWHGGASVETCG